MVVFIFKFLSSALGEWSASGSGCFTLQERTQLAIEYVAKWVHRDGLDVVKK
jgi:hypothetical protein